MSGDWSLFWFILICAFLFSGEPDLWDKLHERAMVAADIKCVKE